MAVMGPQMQQQALEGRVLLLVVRLLQRLGASGVWQQAAVAPAEYSGGGQTQGAPLTWTTMKRAVMGMRRTRRGMRSTPWTAPVASAMTMAR
jgi:hypothetical protein